MTKRDKLSLDERESARHRKTFLLLFTRLARFCPPHMYVVADEGGVRWQFNAETELEARPDILVSHCVEVIGTTPIHPGPPLLAVDLLGPRGNLLDLDDRKQTYARFGVRSYWVADPFLPGLTVFELDEDGEYRRIVKVSGNEAFVATIPFETRIVLTESLSAIQNAGLARHD